MDCAVSHFYNDWVFSLLKEFENKRMDQIPAKSEEVV
jgi:hypothetical protein